MIEAFSVFAFLSSMLVILLQLDFEICVEGKGTEKGFARELIPFLLLL